MSSIVKRCILELVTEFNRVKTQVKLSSSISSSSSSSYDDTFLALDKLFSLATNSPIPDLIRYNVTSYVLKTKAALHKQRKEHSDAVDCLLQWQPSDVEDCRLKTENLASLYRLLGPVHLDNSILWYKRLVHLELSIEDFQIKPVVGELHNIVGTLYFQKEDYYTALNYFKYAYVVAVCMESDNCEAANSALINMGETFRKLGLDRVSKGFFSRVFLKMKKEEKRQFLSKRPYLHVDDLKENKLTVPPALVPFKVTLISTFVKNIVPFFSPKFLRVGQKIFLRKYSSSKVRINRMTMAYVDPDGKNVKCDIHIYSPKNRNEGELLPCTLFFHGGGFVLGNINQLDHFIKSIVEKGPMIVFALDYRKAPENPLPCPYWDAFAFLKWIKLSAPSFGADLTKLTISGESAGGQLSIICSQYIRNEEYKLYPKKDLHIIPIYPAVDGSFALARTYSKNVPYVDEKSLKYFARLALPTRVLDEKCFPNGFKNVSDLPTNFIITAEYCMLREEGYVYFKRVRDENENTKIDYKMVKDECHGFLTPHLGLRPDSIEEVVDDFVKSVNSRFMDIVNEEVVVLV